MPTFEVDLSVNASPKKTFEVAQDIEKFPEFAPELKAVTVLARNGGKVVSKWVGTAEVVGIVRDFVWEEEDEWDKEKLKCKFRLIRGDLKAYEGEWSFLPGETGGTLCRLEISYELGIPLLGAMLEKLIHDKIVDSSKSILSAVKKLAEMDAEDA